MRRSEIRQIERLDSEAPLTETLAGVSMVFVNLREMLLPPDLSLPFLTIALAELGDKSQVLIFLLASRTKKHFQFLLGVMLGFLLVDGFAILIGAWIVDLIPSVWLKLLTGFLFIGLGTLILLSKENMENEKEPELKNPFITGFVLIALAEWGDKTQIASALFASQYDPKMVLLSVMAALLLLSASAVFLGKLFAHRINKNLTAKISGFLFIGLGLASLFL